MKMIIRPILLIILIFLQACGGGDKNNEEQNQQPARSAPNIEIETVDDKIIALKWDDNFSADNFKVYVSTSEDFAPDTLEIITTGKHRYVLNNLEAGTTYYIQIIAVWGDMESKTSNVLEFTKLPNSPDSIVIDTNSSDNKITWQGLAGSFNIYWSTDPDFLKDNAQGQTLGVTQNTFTPDFSDYDNGDELYIRVAAIKNGVESELSVAIKITVADTSTKPVNQMPIALANVAKTNIIIGTTVRLNGSQSYDPEGSVLTHSWSFQSALDKNGSPVANTADLLNDITLSQPLFTPLVAGTYVLQLVVSDGVLNSEAKSISIIAEDTPVAVTYQVGISSVNSLSGNGLVLQNNDGDDLIVGNQPPYLFSIPFHEGDEYHVSVLSQPTNPPQECTVDNPQGLVGPADVMLSLNCMVVENNTPPAFEDKSFSILENSLTVTEPVTATDADKDKLVYSIIGGADVAAFSVHGETGVITITKSPDYENPTDANKDNVYELRIQVSDSETNAQRDVLLSVVDENETPSIVTETLTILENTLNTTQPVTATDPENDDVTFEITDGADAGLFSINATSGLLTIGKAPDYETPIDADANNVFELEIQVSDGKESSSASILVNVGPVNEKPQISNADSFAIDEGKDFKIQIQASDPEGVSLAYKIKNGPDKPHFTVSTGGELSLNLAPDYENPVDEGANNQYEITIVVSDGINTVNQFITLDINPVNEFSPTFITSANQSILENTTDVTKLQAIDNDNTVIHFTVSGDDAAFFKLNNNGKLLFVTKPDYELPKDKDKDNVYEIIIEASDGEKSTPLMMSINVTDLAAVQNIVMKDAAGQTLVAHKVVLENNLAYILAYLPFERSGYSGDNQWSIHVYDVYINENPVALGVYQLGDRISRINDLEVVEGVAYIAHEYRDYSSADDIEESGLHIIKLKKPGIPCLLNKTLTPGYVKSDRNFAFGIGFIEDLTVSGNKLYLVYAIETYRNDGFAADGMQIYDISGVGTNCETAQAPVLDSHLVLDIFEPQSIAVDNGVAYIGSIDYQSYGPRTGLVMVDVNNPKKPTLMNIKDIFSTEKRLLKQQLLYDTPVEPFNPVDYIVNYDTQERITRKIQIIDSTLYAMYTNYFEYYFEGFTYTDVDEDGIKSFDLKKILPFSYKKNITSAIADAGDDLTNYQTIRVRNGSLKWEIPIISSTGATNPCASGCDVRLMFIESYWGTATGTTCTGGERTFSIRVEGVLYESDYDICAKTNAPLTADEYVINDLFMEDGILTVDLGKGSIGNDKKPAIAGLHITSADGYSNLVDFGDNQFYWSDDTLSDTIARLSDAPIDGPNLPLDETSSRYIKDFAIQGSTVYAVSGSSVQLIDIRNAKAPGLIGFLKDVDINSRSIALQGDHLISANGSDGFSFITLSETEIIPAQ